MLLQDLLAPWFHYSGQESVNQLTLDSRHIQAGDLFIAIPGHVVDGRNYIPAAAKQGAVASLVHTDDPKEHGQVTVAQVPHLTNPSDDPKEHGQVTHAPHLVIHFFQLKQQLSALAAQAYPLASDRLKLIGVTGTNGKTSVTQFIAQLLQLQQRRAAVMGTLGNGPLGALVESNNTTSDPLSLMQALHRYDKAQLELCAMEVSSHGLVQSRVQAVPFDVAVFTNLSRDHLDYHASMDEYAAAKRRLFDCPSLQAAVLNLDDPIGQNWLQELNQAKGKSPRLLSFSASADPRANVYAKNIRYHGAGVSATLVWPEGEAECQSPLLGAFNLSNLLAALTALYALGENMAQLVSLVPSLTPVAGRMERFTRSDHISLVVDYAHTPDAVSQALAALRQHCQGQLWCVLGCGGNRDKGKRPLMAQAAAKGADKIMLTSDNARDEDPLAIIKDMQAGLTQPALVEVDRQQAIRAVLQQASSGDLILLAGKGHERYQEIKGIKYDYDERQLAAQLTEEEA